MKNKQTKHEESLSWINAALFKLDDIRFSGAHDPLAALILCGAYQADKVMVAGKWKISDDQVIGLDLAQLMYNHRNAANRLAQKAQLMRR